MCSTVLKMSFILSWVYMSHGRSALRVIGGKDADEDKYPFVVRLQNKLTIFASNVTLNFHVCTGALITPTWTVTAGHCVGSRKITNLFSLIPYIRVGTVSEVQLQLNESIRIILKSVKHPKFISEDFALRNDIALIKSEAVTLTQYACISGLDGMTLIGLESTATGYGVTNMSGEVDDATTLQKPLQTLDVIVVQCEEEIRMKVSPYLCVARRCGQSAGLCPGDSGGPLLHSSGILGVNSCGPLSLPTFCALIPTKPVYDVAIITPINPFTDWIRNTIEQDSLSLDAVT